MVPDVFSCPLANLPPGWMRIASELSEFCLEEGAQSGMSFRDLWQVICRDYPDRLAVEIFPPGSAVLERVSEDIDEQVLLDLLVFAGAGSLEAIEGKTVLAILKKHCPKPAKQKPLTLSERHKRVNAMRRKNR